MDEFVGDPIQIQVRHEYGQCIDGTKESPYTETEKLQRQKRLEVNRAFKCPSCHQLAGRLGRDAVGRVWITDNGKPPDGWKDPTMVTPECCGVKFPMYILHDFQEEHGVPKW